MSDIVKDIREAVETRITTVLGATWKPLKHKFDLTKNNFKNSDKRFGVIALEGPPGISILKNYTVNRTFVVTFLTGFTQINRDDTNQQEALDTLESALDEVLVDLINSKAGSPANVLNISLLGIDEPDFSIEHVTFVNLTLNIAYKRLLS